MKETLLFLLIILLSTLGTAASKTHGKFHSKYVDTHDEQTEICSPAKVLMPARYVILTFHFEHSIALAREESRIVRIKIRTRSLAPYLAFNKCLSALWSHHNDLL